MDVIKPTFIHGVRNQLIEFMHAQFNLTALQAVGLMDSNGKRCALKYPLVIREEDPSFIQSVKSTLNNLYHFNEELLALEALSKQDAKRWFHTLRMMPSAYRLIQQLLKHKESMIHLVENATHQMKKHEQQLALYKQNESVISQVKEFFLVQVALIQTLKAFIEEETLAPGSIEALGDRLMAFTQINPDLVGRCLSLVASMQSGLRGEDFVKHYMDFLDKDVTKFLASMALLKASDGLKQDDQFIKSMLKSMHEKMLKLFPQNQRLKAIDVDTVCDSEKMLALNVKRLKTSYEDALSQSLHVNEFLMALSRCDKATFSALNKAQLAHLKTLYTTIQGSFSKHYPWLDTVLVEILNQVQPLSTQASDLKLSTYIQAAKHVLVVTRNDVKDSVFTYKGLNGDIKKISEWQADADKRTYAERDKQKAATITPLQAMHADVIDDRYDYKAFMGNLLDSENQLLQEMKGKRLKMEAFLSSNLSPVLLKKLDFSKHPMDINESKDAQQVQFIKHLVNAFYHAERSFECCINQQTKKWYNPMKYFASWLGKRHLLKSAKSISELPSSSTWFLQDETVSKEALFIFPGALNFARLTHVFVTTNQAVMPQLFDLVKTTIVHTATDAADKCLGDLYGLFSDLAQMDTLTVDSISSKVTRLQASVSWLTAVPSTSKDYLSAQSMLSLSTILMKLYQSRGRWNTEVFTQFQTWFDDNYLNTLVLLDRTEEHLGLRRGALSEQFVEKVLIVQGKLKDEGMALNMDAELEDKRKVKTSEAITAYKLLLDKTDNKASKLAIQMRLDLAKDSLQDPLLNDRSEEALPEAQSSRRP